MLITCCGVLSSCSALTLSEMRKPRVAPSSATRPRRDGAAPAAMGGPWTLPRAGATGTRTRRPRARVVAAAGRRTADSRQSSRRVGWRHRSHGVGRVAHRPRHRSQGCELPMPSRSLRGRYPRPADLNSRRLHRRRPTYARHRGRRYLPIRWHGRPSQTAGRLGCFCGAAARHRSDDQFSGGTQCGLLLLRVTAPVGRVIRVMKCAA